MFNRKKIKKLEEENDALKLEIDIQRELIKTFIVRLYKTSNVPNARTIKKYLFEIGWVNKKGKIIK